MTENEPSLRKKKVAVTGATGFIGQYLTRALCADGRYCCRLLIRNQTRAEQLFGDIREALEFVEMDLADPNSLEGCFQGCDIVVHLAALVTHTAALDEALAVNRDGVMHLVCEAKKAGVSKFIHTSSTAAIGELKGYITEETACKPVMSYQIAKYESEKVCLTEYAQNGFPALIIRPSMIYGEGVKQDLLTISKIAKMFRIYPIVGRGENCSPALYISDMVQALLLLIEKGEPGEIYNISSEESYPIKRKVRVIANTLGTKVWTPHLPAGLLIAAFQIISAVLRCFHMQFDMQPQNILNSQNDRFFDISKIAALGFRQRVSLEEGIERTVHDFVKRGLL